MFYNVMIFGKRYRNKDINFIYSLLEKYADDIDNGTACGLPGVAFDIVHMGNNTERLAYYNHSGKVAISINKVK